MAESQPIPLSRTSLEGSTLRSRKVSSIVVATKEAMDVAGPVTEAGLQRDLERAVVDALDMAFIDATNAGATDERPASIAYERRISVTNVPESAKALIRHVVRDRAPKRNLAANGSFCSAEHC